MNKQKKQPQFIVCVRCMTFNHVNYITDAMNGFTMQETTFPFVCTIIDDASTDGEQVVIKKYIEQHFDLDDESTVRNEETDDYVLTFARHKTNRNCYFAVLYLKYNHYSIKKSKDPYIKEWMDVKYIALCEGDDYWTHPRKLQMQVDFLGQHQSVLLVHTSFQFFYQKTQTFCDSIPVDNNLENIEIIKEILNYNKYRIQTCTVMFRRDSFNKSKEINKIAFNNPYFLMGDTQMWIGMLEIGNISYLSDITSVYRVHNESVTCRGDNSIKKLRFDLSCSEMRLFFINKLNLNQTFKKEIESVFYHQLFKYVIFCPEYIPYNDCNTRNKCILFLIKTPIIRQILKFYLVKKGLKEL